MSYEINEGRARDHERRAIYDKLPTTDPTRSRQLFNRCTGPKGKFTTEEAAERHYIALASFGRKTSKPVWETGAVPEQVFHALSIDPTKTFGPGICFWPFDVFLNEDIPGCTSFTATQFRWARRVGNLWVISLRHGGASTRDSYAAVQPSKHGAYRKIWWADSLAGLAAWHAKGAVPLADVKPE